MSSVSTPARSRQPTSGSVDATSSPSKKRNGGAMFEGSIPPPLPPRRPASPSPASLHVNYGTMRDHHAGDEAKSDFLRPDSPQRERMRSLQSDLDSIRDTAHNAIGSLLERGEGLTEIQRRSAVLIESTNVFRRRAQERVEVARAQWRYHHFMYGVVVLVVLFVVICFISWLSRQPF
ncbi:hypothetical protein H9P43_001256 [Blastocladiella emersonii ATCC 22665]|nr:hypothetical protein H9P43_001256 [Blastocladiella emersonii ATCC 22665]